MSAKGWRLSANEVATIGVRGTTRPCAGSVDLATITVTKRQRKISRNKAKGRHSKPRG